MRRTTLAVEATGLRKHYDERAALDGFDLAVPAGTVCGLLGPNGAGKTTAVRILTTLLRADGGSARVAGFDVEREADQVRHRIGLVGQHPAVDELLGGHQNLTLFGRLFHLAPKAARRRADELLAQFGLTDAGAKPISDYSGGMRRRLDLAASLILAPPVLFLDEPTTGLDPRGRSEVWSAVRRLVADGTSVLLTTQYLDEADQLADQISVIDHGRVIADGSPEALKSRLGADRIDLVVVDAADLASAADELAACASGPVEVDRDRRRLSAPVDDRMGALAAIVARLGAARIEAEDIAVRRPTLDEVFLHLTGGRRDGPAALPIDDQATTEVSA